MNPDGLVPTCSSIPKSAHSDPHPISLADLRALKFFEGLSDAHLQEIRPHTKVSYFDPGDVILGQGELANRFYVITSGRVAVECNIGGRVYPLQESGPGDVVGFSWCFTPENLQFSVRALEPVRAIFFYGTLLREDCELDSSLGYELALRMGRVLMQRMDALVALLAKKG
jgi:CRP/FNR family transcriptional regulator, cyclic AMP receptor protein